MVCLICGQSELVDTLTTVSLVRAEMRFAIQGVPALRCPECQDAVVAADVALRMLRGAEEMSDAGMIEGVQDFQNL